MYFFILFCNLQIQYLTIRFTQQFGNAMIVAGFFNSSKIISKSNTHLFSLDWPLSCSQQMFQLIPYQLCHYKFRNVYMKIINLTVSYGSSFLSECFLLQNPYSHPLPQHQQCNHKHVNSKLLLQMVIEVHQMLPLL